MSKRKVSLMLLCSVLLLAISICYINSVLITGDAPALSKLGSKGDEVIKIQTKLKGMGIYTGKIDGVYGNLTRQAVVSFQQKNGLTADGIAGQQTLSKLGLAAAPNPAGNDLNLLARIISAEARGETYEGQVAVGGVILNRVRHPSFPNSISGVVYQPGAFTAVSDGQINLPVYDICYKAASDAMNGWDPSQGSLYYYNPAKTSNQWMLSRPKVRTIGAHIFCK